MKESLRNLIVNQNGPRKTMPIMIAAAVGLLLLIGAGWWVYELQTTISTDDARVSGDIVEISPKIAGRIDQIQVKEGDVVAVGQLLLTLDNEQYRIGLNQAQAALDLAKANAEKLPEDLTSAKANAEKGKEGLFTAQAQVKSAEVNIEDAKRNLDKIESLYEAGAVAKESLDSARSRYDNAKAALEAARTNAMAYQAAMQDSEAKWQSLNKTGVSIYDAQVRQAQAVYDSAKHVYDNSFISAPRGGTVIKIPVQMGQNVAAGQSLVTICDLQSTWVTTNIEEKKINRVAVGQKVDVKIDAYSGVFEGKIIEIGNATQSTFAMILTENTSGNYTKVNQRIPVKIMVEKQGMVFKPGMSAVVTIHTKG